MEVPGTMKVIVVFRRKNEKEIRAYFIEERESRHELANLQKNGHEVLCLIHVAVSARIQYVEDMPSLEVREP